MKRFNITAVLLLSSMIACFADVSDRIAVVRGIQPDVFNLCYRTLGAEDVKVTIYNNKREIVFSEMLRKTTSFNRPYNFGSLEEGDYRIVTESKNEKLVTTVSHLRERKKSTIEVSRVSDDVQKYRVKVISPEEEEVTIRIYNNRSMLLHEEVVGVTDKYDRIYNLEKVSSFEGSILFFEIETSRGQIETALY